jgi:hypothetical protein
MSGPYAFQAPPSTKPKAGESQGGQGKNLGSGWATETARLRLEFRPSRGRAAVAERKAPAEQCASPSIETGGGKPPADSVYLG